MKTTPSLLLAILLIQSMSPVLAAKKSANAVSASQAPAPGAEAPEAIAQAAPVAHIQSSAVRPVSIQFPDVGTPEELKDKNSPFYIGEDGVTPDNPANIEELKVLAEDAQKELKEIRTLGEGLPSEDRIKLYLDRTANIIKRTDKRYGQSLFLKVLARGIMFAKMVFETPKGQNQGLDVVAGILNLSMTVAEEYYNAPAKDMAQEVDGKLPEVGIETVDFSLKFYPYVFAAIKSIPMDTNPKKLEILIKTLQFMILDLGSHKPSRQTYARPLYQMWDVVKNYIPANPQLSARKKLSILYQNYGLYISPIAIHTPTPHEMELASLKVGKLVFYESTIREIEAITTDGKVILKEDAGSYATHTTTDKIKCTVENFGDFSVGETVLYSSTYRVISYLSQDGQVILAESTDSYSTVTTVDSLSKFVGK